MTLEEAITKGSHASADLTGNGYALSLKYSSKKPFAIYVLFLRKDGSFSGEETIRETYDADESGTALIELFRSPGWKPQTTTYRLHFLGDSTDMPTFHDSTFIETPLRKYPSILLSQLLHTQSYTPSVYHRLTGRQMFGVSLVMLCGTILAIAFIALSLRGKKAFAIHVAVTVTLFVSLLTSFDLLQYMWHVPEWQQSAQYGTAGSLVNSAAIARKEHATGVLLCTDDTSYAATLLAYHLYPQKIVATLPSHIVVHHAMKSRFANGSLSCGGHTYVAEEIQTFSDGTVIYRTHASP